MELSWYTVALSEMMDYWTFSWTTFQISDNDHRWSHRLIFLRSGDSNLWCSDHMVNRWDHDMLNMVIKWRSCILINGQYIYIVVITFESRVINLYRNNLYRHNWSLLIKDHDILSSAIFLPLRTHHIIVINTKKTLKCTYTVEKITYTKKLKTLYLNIMKKDITILTLQ